VAIRAAGLPRRTARTPRIAWTMNNETDSGQWLTKA
jgi:hypothetical protein